MGDGRGRPPNKLQTIRKGPTRVVALNKDAYDVFDLVNRKIDTVHVSRLYPFYYDPEKVDPENVAIRDQGEFIVTEIVDAITDPTLPKNRWSFRVRWQGYNESFDEWLDWSELRNVEALHTYLRKARFIPKSGQILEDRPLRRLKAPIPKGLTDTPRAGMPTQSANFSV
jgi:hypothetical protein